MKNKIIWLSVCCLMVVALLVTSCGGGEEVINGEGEEEVINGEEEEEEQEEIGDGIETVIDVLGREVEKPRYGGSFNYSRTTDVRGFDETLGSYQTYTKRLTHDELFTGDYTKGPTGTGETTWSTTGSLKWQDEVPLAATSFEHPEPGILRWHIRQGIYFHDKPPVNGREMNAHDVVASLERLFTIPTSYLCMTYPEGKRPISYTAVDDWTVELEVPEDNWGALRNVISDFVAIEAEENIEANDNDLNNWEIDIGTGPYMMTDYVPVSSLTFEKNPNYWRTHPLYPEDTMPYVDTINIYVLADVSTRMAAFRTGKIETMPGVGWEDWEDFMRTNPDLKYIHLSPAGNGAIFMRVDKPELPYQDKRVRHALMLAIDQDDIVENYYNGHAVKYNYPACQLAEYSRAHYPFEQLSQDVQDLFGYDPDKAKQLLTEAGYPDGFECSILMSSAAAEGMAPVIKDFWEKNLNAVVNMDVKDSTVISSILRGMQQEDMYYGGADGTAILKFHEYRQDDWMNYSRVNDPVCEDMWQQISEYNYDFDAVSDIIYENAEYLLDQCYFVLLPSPESFYLLQPWLKDWNGEYTTGYYNYYMPAIYVWIDQDLRKEMTGRTE